MTTRPMNAVILAAGMGTRLRPLSQSLPKCLLEIEEKSLLERSLDHLREHGISQVIVVTGFQEHLIKQRVGSAYHGLDITYITNAQYAYTGSMYSLSQTKERIDEDILLLESDLLYEKRAIEILLNSAFENVILVSALLHTGDDVYVCVNEEQMLRNLGKHIPDKEQEQAAGCLVGISKFSLNFLSIVFERAEKDYTNGIYNDHYEKTVYKVNQTGTPVYVELCRDLQWTEIDTAEDLRRAKEVIYPKIQRGDC